MLLSKLVKVKIHGSSAIQLPGKLPDNYENIEVTGLSLDSRTCKPGYLFAAIRGANTNGLLYIHDAIARGARVILTSLDVKPDKSWGDDVVLITHDNTRLAFGHLCAEFYSQQPDNIAAVTGTNGKTSVVNFCRQIWQNLGHNAASIGTLGVIEKTGQDLTDDTLTTPDPVFLHEKLSNLKTRNFNYLAMEASSHGLDQFRLAGLDVGVAAITNISRDHLDYHGSYERYFDAKMLLFEQVMKENGIAVVNADIPEFAEIKKRCEKHNHTIVSYGKQGMDLQLLDSLPSPSGQEIIFKTKDKEYSITTSLIGSFQSYNVLCAIGMVVASGFAADEVVEACKGLLPVPGRMEKVAEHPCGAPILVDYAHTPDALEKILIALRPHTENNLVVMFGCGGDRDKGKRPQMGEIAERLADKIIITDDNPRTEAPSPIRAEIMQACPSATEIGDRREAIRHAIQNLEAGDVLVLAGKGHETYQILGTTKHHFNDAEEAKDAVDSS